MQVTAVQEALKIGYDVVDVPIQLPVCRISIEETLQRAMLLLKREAR